MATPRYAIRNDTAANWTSANPTLGDGEWGYETDTGKLKIGDGATAWNSLGYTYTNNTTTVTSAYTVAANVDTVYVDASGGAATVTLPALTGNIGRKITIRALDATNTITIARAGSDTIANALTSVTLSSDRDYWTLEAGPTQWELVAGYETIDGTYDGIKRFEGTMEQWGGRVETVDISFSSGVGGFTGSGADVTFPVPFVASGPARVIIGSVRGADAQVLAEGGDTDGFRPRYRAVSSVTGETVWFNWHAIGRWY
jgi:hypothetical protein